MYAALKHIHVTTAILSVSLFLLRGAWMLSDSTMLHRRWVRIVPHVIDTVLLVSAIAMVVIIRQYPFVHGWLTAKVIALFAYIILGTIALKRGKSKTIQVLALLAALLTVAYIVTVALSRRAVPFLSSLPALITASA